MKVDYREYIQSEEWKEKSWKLRDAIGMRELCFDDSDLVVHHVSYVNLGAETDEDLRVVCKGCHEELHFERGKKLKVTPKSLRRRWRTVLRRKEKIRQKMGLPEQKPRKDWQMFMDDSRIPIPPLKSLILSYNVYSNHGKVQSYEDYLELKRQRRGKKNRGYYLAAIQFEGELRKHIGGTKVDTKPSYNAELVLVNGERIPMSISSLDGLSRLMDSKLFKVGDVLYPTHSILKIRLLADLPDVILFNF